MPLRDFIQNVVETHGKSFCSVKDLIEHLEHRVAPHKTYSWYVHEILNIKVARCENVSQFNDRITSLISGAQAALEDKHINTEQLSAPLNDRVLEFFIRKLPDELSGAVKKRNPNSPEIALKYAIEYEASYQWKTQTNNFHYLSNQ